MLLELVRLLGEYRDDVVIVGGWVPELLMPNEGHIGSTDIDLALNHKTLQDPGYATVLTLLKSRGYEQDEQQPFIFRRHVEVEGVAVTVEVDFLAAEYGGTGRSRRTQRVQDVRARKARGADLAFALNEKVLIEGELPEGSRDAATVQVASIVPFIVMKSMALAGRLKEKDAWDIWFCLRHYADGLDAIVEAFRPHLLHGLVREGLEHLGEKFASPEHVGPRFVADFDGLDDPDDRALQQRDAYERVNYLLTQLGIHPS